MSSSGMGRCPLFDVVYSALPLPTTASLTLQGTLKESFREDFGPVSGEPNFCVCGILPSVSDYIISSIAVITILLYQTKQDEQSHIFSTFPLSNTYYANANCTQ